MQVLVIGGTRYVGRHLVENLLDRGHEVTLFHRGQTNSDLFPDVERILGDRTTDADRLRGRSWDAVIDTCGYEADEVAPTVDVLADAVDRYVFISSLATYEPTAEPGVDEGAPVQRDPDPDDPVVWWHDKYARDKVACEDVVTGAFGDDRSLLLRPGMLVGPYDPVWYLPTWVARFLRGGEVLVPDAADQPLQILDARDLAAFTGRQIDDGVTGVFTVTGPQPPLRYGDFLERTAATVGAEIEFAPVDADWLAARDEAQDPWLRLPYWLPSEEVVGYCSMDTTKAVAHGLQCRPLEETVADVAAWYEAEAFADRDDWPGGRPPSRGLDPDVEATLLAAATADGAVISR